MSRDDFSVDPKPISVSELIDTLHSKVATQIDHAGFELRLSCGDAAVDQILRVDPDACVQILINLVDNAIKFSAQAEQGRIDIGCVYLSDGHVEFRVRDRGPGIAEDQMK